MVCRGAVGDIFRGGKRETERERVGEKGCRVGFREDLQRSDIGASGGFLELEEGQQTVKRGETQQSPGSFQLEGSLSGAFSGPYTCCSRSP